MPNEALKALLINLKDKDFELREELLEQGALYSGYDERMEALHIENAEKLNVIIKEHGWPGKSQVGKDGAYAAFVLAQHAISKPALQKYFFQQISKAVKNEEASPRHAACLEDRILFNQARPLKYGMLFDWDENGIFSTNVDDNESCGPPPDYHEHKRMENEWAKRVGWLEQ